MGNGDSGLNRPPSSDNETHMTVSVDQMHSALQGNQAHKMRMLEDINESENEEIKEEEEEEEESSEQQEEGDDDNQSKRGCACESTVLIVDDNMFNIIPLEYILSDSFQIKSDKALNGQEAVAAFSRNLNKACCGVRYKMVLMDLNMPIMDGYEATTNILSLFWRKQQKDLEPNFNSS